jgi:PKD repeat protein
VAATATASVAALVFSVSVLSGQSPHASVTLVASVSPLRGQPEVNVVTVTGSGFPAGTIEPAATTVTLAPAPNVTGPTVTVAPSAIVLVKNTSRRFSFIVPAALTLPKAAKYTIRIAGKTTTGDQFESLNAARITIIPPAVIRSIRPKTIAPGATATVKIKTRYTDLFQGVTIARFGPGISVGGAAEGGFGPVTVTSPTTADAQITVSAGASGGFRVVTVKTGVQEASLSDSFSVGTAPVPPPPAPGLPTIKATVTPPANANGWHSTAVTVSFTCGPAGASIVSCSQPVTVSTEGAKQVITGTVRDKAGKEASTSVTLNIDRTAPTISATPKRAANGAGWYNAAVAVAFSCADSGSGIASCPADVTVDSEGAAQIITRSVTDRAGNSASASATIKLDKTAPQLTVTAPADGAVLNTSPANVSGNVSDALSGVASASCNGSAAAVAGGVLSCHVPLQNGSQQIATVAVDAAGNQASRTVTVSFTSTGGNRAPVAVAGGPYTADAGTPVNFNGSQSADPDGDVLSYAWTFGDGGTGNGERPRRTYLGAGQFTATLTVSDGRGGSHSSTASVTIRAANRKPIAAIGGPYSGITSQPINFSAAQSSDPDNDPLTYAWSFGDGGTGTGKDLSHVYTTAGPFSVSVSVSDNRGGSSTASAQVNVTAANRAPTAHAGGPYSGRAGVPIAFNATQSSDPDGDPLTYAWSFGDGGSRTGAQPEHTFDASGKFTITLTVADTRGSSHTTSVEANISAALPGDNHAPIARAGGPYAGEVGVPVFFNGSTSSDADGDALQYAWSFGDGAKATGPSPTHAFTEAKSFAVQLTVSDGRGGSHSSTATAVIAAPVDRIPPVVSLAGQTQVLPGTAVVVTATAVDNVSVSSVSFAVNGSQSSTTTTSPYQRTVAIPPVASPGTTMEVTAVAKDPTGNTGNAALSLTIVAEPDTVAPTVTLAAPAETAGGASLRVGATATDASGIASVNFRINGVATPASGPPYYATYQVPANTAAGTAIAVVVEAFDYAGNRGTAEGIVTVAAARDLTPPTVTLTAPATSRPGVQVSLLANAADQGGIAAVTFSINNVEIASIAGAPYQTTFHIPDNAATGMRFNVVARAVDFAGLESTDTDQIEILDAAGGDALLTGEVYDDSTGLPLADASVVLIVGGAPAAAPVVTDARGRYALGAPSGEVAVRVARAGWTTVERVLTIGSGQAREVFDARLTPVAGPAQSVAGLAATLQHNGVVVTLPAGAVSSPVSLTLTRVSGQGLRGLLPRGWAPVAAFDIAPSTVAFLTSPVARAPRNGLPSGVPLVFAKWDETARVWRAIGTTVTGPPAELLQAGLDGGGQYAWLKADVLPAAPPSPGPGAPLAGVAASELPDAVQTVVNPQPKVMVYQPGVRSDVAGTVTFTGPLSSGMPLWSRIVESYSFASNGEIHPEPFVQDLVFYQRPDDSKVLLASYIVTPSIEFEPASLQQGVIGVELFVPPPAAADVVAIGAAGGHVALPSGERLDIAPGLTDTNVAVRIEKLSADHTGVTVPTGFAFVNAVTVELTGGTFTNSAVLSVPKPAGIADSAQLLLTRVDTIQGQTKLVLVALGSIAGDRIVSSALLPRNKVPLEGIRRDGRYVFLRATAPVGFVAGLVLSPGGGAFAGAQVSADTVSIVALSRTPGGYVAVATVGTTRLTALDPIKLDSGLGQVGITAAAAEVALDLRLVPQPPRVVSVSPGNGSKNIALSDPITVVFSEPIEASSLAGNVRLVGPDGAVNLTSALAANSTTLTLRPAQPLDADALHTLTVEKVKDRAGYELAAPVVVQFTTLDTTAPAPPAAGSLSATIPEGGTTTVRGTQGTAGAHDTVVVENRTRGTSTPVLLDPNGGFLVVVPAALLDVLKIKITDQSGNETILDVPAFTRTNADGSVSGVVGTDGGRVLGPNGIAADIQPDTFPPGTVVTLTSISEANFPMQLSGESATVFPFAGGIEIDFGGAEPQKYINLSIPATVNDTVRDQWIVGQVVEIAGEQVVNMVDTARLIDQRIATASPPCPGVIGAGIYGIYRSTRQVGIGAGSLYSFKFGGLETLPASSQLAAFFAMPFVFAYGGFPIERTMCLPVLTGNVTVVPNTMTLRIEAANVTPADRQFVVKNLSNNTESHIARDVLEYRFDVPGATHNSFQVIAQTASGPRVLTGVAVRAGAPGRVIIVVDLDTIDFAVSGIVVRNLSVTPVLEHPFPQQSTSVDLKVSGGFNDNYEVKAVSATGIPRPLPFLRVQVIDNLVGTGNLLARAATGAIDPTPSQIAEYNARPACGQLDQPPACRTTPVFPTNKGVTEVYLADRNSGENPANRCRFTKCWTIPLASIINGGFAFAFNGDITHQFVMVVYRENGESEETDISIFRITVRNPQTGRVVHTITGQAPPRNEPIDLGFITDDTTAPKLTKTPQTLQRFDPSSPLSFTFSEGINYDSLRDGAYVERVVNGNTTRVNGEWVISDQNRVATFIPEAPLQIAAEYKVTFSGADRGVAAIFDRGRNKLAQTVEFTVKTFKPRVTARLDSRASDTLPKFEAVKDVAVIRDRDSNNALRTRLLAVTDTDAGYKLLAIDATDARTPVETGKAFDGRRQMRVAAIQDVENLSLGTQAGNPYIWPTECVPSSKKFNGDLAVSVTTNVTQTSVQFFDVTNPAAPCQLGGKPIAVNPEQQSDFNKRGTFLVAGTGLGLSTIKHSTGYAAYVAIAGVGLAAVDIGRNIPEVLPASRQTEGLLPGDFVDVITVDDRLIALNKSERRLQVLDANLAPIAAIELAEPPRVVAYAEAFLYDIDGDGQIEPSEQRDLAFVGAGGCGPEVDLSYGVCSRSIHIIDLTNPNAPHVIGRIPMPGIVHSIQVDRDRRRVVAGGTRPSVSTPTGLAGDALYLIDVSKPDQIGLLDRDNDADHWDDRIVWHADYVQELNHVKLDTDRGLLYAGFGTVVSPSKQRGLDIWALYDNCCDLAVEMTAVSRPTAFGDRGELLERELEALQQGIAAGLNTAAAECGAASIAEVKLLEQGSGACLWSGDPGRTCGDNYQPGLSDHDYEVLFPGTVPAATQSCVVTRLANIFTDPATDESKPIVMPDGVQMYFDDITFFPFSRDEFYAANLNIEPPRSEQGDTTGDLGLGRQQLLAKWVLEGRYVKVPGFNLLGKPLPEILRLLRESTKIPRVEGYEWSQLQRFNLAKSGAFVRIKGASDVDSTFHSLFIKQLHDAGKAAIRSALARMIADTNGRDRVLAATAEYEDTACLTIEPGQNDPGAWLERPCKSFEEFIASMAGRMLKNSPVLSLFTVQQVHAIQRFYRVKADLERIPGDAEADQFIANAANFVDAVGAATRPIFDALLPSDPRALQRLSNIASAQSKATEALAKGKVTIAPFVANKGFINATQVKVTMYRNGNATPVKTVPVDLSGGDRQRLDYVHTSTGSLLLDAQGKAEPVFRISPIDQNANLGVPMPVSFAIDLPEKKVKEGNRQNNYTGFYYYVLNRTAPTTPQPPAQPPLPIPDPDGRLLAPDPACDEDPAPRFTQTFILSDGQEIHDHLMLGMGETIRIRVEVFNTSGDPLVAARACPGLVDECAFVPTLAPGTGWVREFTYTAPTQSGNFPATAQLTGAFGIVESSKLEVLVACQSFDIVPIIDPEIAPQIKDREVMLGGKALRYYQIVDKRTGRPKANASVKLLLSGSAVGSDQIRTLTTNADGIVISPEALPTEPAIVLATANWGADTELHAEIIEVDGVSLVCGNRSASFDLKITPRTSAQIYQRGAAIEGSVGLVVGIQGTAELGLEMSRKVKSTRAGQFEPTALTLTRNKEAGVKTSVEFNLIPEIKFGVGVVSAELKSTAGTSESTGWSTSDEYTFALNKDVPGGLTDAQQCAIAAITLQPIAALDPLITRLLSLFRKDPCATPDQFLTSTSEGKTRSSGDSVSVGLSAKPFWVKVNNWEKNIGVKASVGGSGLFSIGTLLGQSFDLTPTGPKRTAGNEDYTLSGGINFSSGLTVETEDPGNPSKEEKEERYEVEHFKGALKLSGSSSTAESHSVSFTYAAPPDSSGPTLSGPAKPSSISISYSGPKAFGWKLSEVGGVAVNLSSPSARGKISYSVSDPDAIALLTDPTRGLANLATIQKSNTPGELGALELGFVPSILNTELARFRGLKRQMVMDFGVSNSFGTGYELPIGLTIKELGFKLGGSVTVKSDAKVAYAAEAGMNVLGKELTLERYEKDAFIPAADLGFTDLMALAWEAVLGRYLPSFSDVTKRIGDTIDQIKSNFTATLTVNSAAEAEKFDLGLLSYPFEGLAVAPREGRYVPSNTEGVATDPHYGIGGFHQFTPQDRALARPATLVIDYKDAEIQGLDESSLAIYAWNAEARDWDFVGGTRDAAANTVTTTITQLRLYTLAPAMPRGEVALTVVSDTLTGDDANAKRRIRIASTGSLLMNNGQPVANGTLFTVRSVTPSAGPIVPVGTILTSDADGGRDNVQVPVINGRIEFEIEVPAPFKAVIPAQAVVYSTKGTAFGTTAVQQ